MLKTRIITAFFLIAGLLAAVFLAPESLWQPLTLLIAILALNEWSGLIRLGLNGRILTILLALLLSFILMYGSFAPKANGTLLSLLVLGLASGFWLFIAPLWLLRRITCDHREVMSLLGVLLMISTWIGLIGLHQLSPWLLLAVIATVSIADSAAYFFGKKFGKNKLAPDISPGKTREGVYGALFVITLYGAILYFSELVHWWVIPVLWLLVILSVMGDLFESLLKRKVGMKDSGNLLPGHGGVLDRIDGLLPVLSVTMFFIQLIQLTGIGVNS